MNPFETNNEGFKNYSDDNENNNFHTFDLFKGKTNEIGDHNRIQEIEMKNIISRENNANNYNILFPKNKKFLLESIIFGRNEQNNIILLNRKRNIDKTNEEINKSILDKKNYKEREDIIIKESSNRGRRKKNVKYANEPEHDKFKEDNIIQKIKKSVFDYILIHLNKSLKYEMYKFYPLSKQLNINLKKDFNEKLLNRTIYDIYMKEDLNKRYINVPDSNRTLINKIYEEKIEADTINILGKTFKEILDDIREKDLDSFLNEFKKNEIKRDDKLIDKYMKDVKKMLFKYEFWFKAKLGRNSRKA